MNLHWPWMKAADLTDNAPRDTPAASLGAVVADPKAKEDGMEDEAGRYADEEEAAEEYPKPINIKVEHGTCATCGGRGYTVSGSPGDAPTFYSKKVAAEQAAGRLAQTCAPCKLTVFDADGEVESMRKVKAKATT